MSEKEYTPYPHRFHGHLFQAQMWREYAMVWGGKRTRSGVDKAWMAWTGMPDRSECMRRAKIHAQLAREKNATSKSNII